MTPDWDIDSIRGQFPALAREIHGRPAVYFDGPAGSQTPRRVADAVAHYLLATNANHGGLFTTSRESDTLVHEGHQAVADLLGAPDADLIAFGANMTTMTFALSRALAKAWKPGDEIVVTRLDHDANVTPWVLAARDAGVEVHHIGIHPKDCTLDLDDFAAKLSRRTRLVAVSCASNAVGTINPVRRMIEQAHAAGALVFLDAVHLAPHAPMDVVAWDCDFLSCSAYKFFGPHLGILYGKREHLERLPAYKLRPAPDALPGRWMTGTPSFEAIAGTSAAVEYLADLGRSPAAVRKMVPTGAEPASTVVPTQRRQALTAAFKAIQEYESDLCARLLGGLRELAHLRVWGITDPTRWAERVPTVAVTHRRHAAHTVAEHLDHHGIFVWHGNFYAQSLSETLGLEPEGMVRIGLLHYNTAEEVDRVLDVLAAFH